MSSAVTWLADCFTVHAESTVTVPSTPSNAESVSPKSNEKEEPDQAEEEEKSEETEKEGGEDIEEGSEEEEEAEDQKPAIVEACEATKACAPLKHHFDECQERVLNHSGEDAEHHENCVEEMFHLMHCVDQCMAPKLFAALKWKSSQINDVRVHQWENTIWDKNDRLSRS